MMNLNLNKTKNEKLSHEHKPLVMDFIHLVNVVAKKQDKNQRQGDQII